MAEETCPIRMIVEAVIFQIGICQIVINKFKAWCAMLPTEGLIVPDIDPLVHLSFLMVLLLCTQFHY